jgi:hypothetical protein
LAIFGVNFLISHVYQGSGRLVHSLIRGQLPGNTVKFNCCGISRSDSALDQLPAQPHTSRCLILRLRGGSDEHFGDMSLIGDPLIVFKDGYQDPDEEIWETPKWKAKIRHRQRQREATKWKENNELGTTYYVASKEYMDWWEQNQHTIPHEVREKYRMAEDMLDEEFPAEDAGSVPRIANDVAGEHDKSFQSDIGLSDVNAGSKREMNDGAYMPSSKRMRGEGGSHLQSTGTERQDDIFVAESDSVFQDEDEDKTKPRCARIKIETATHV